MKTSKKEHKSTMTSILINIFVWFTFVLLLLFLNITKVVNLVESVKINMALSDIILPFFLISSLFLWKKLGFNIVYRYASCWIILLLWIVVVGFCSIQNDLIKDNGWFGIFEELVKTGICILYFFAGYNTLRVLKINTFQITWSLSTIIFIFGGFVIYLLAINGYSVWSSDINYTNYYMGTDSDPNHAATFLTLSFFSMGIFALNSKQIGYRVYFSFLMMITATGLVFTGSRGGLLGFIIGIFVLLVYYAYKNWRVALAMVLVFVMMSMSLLIVDHYYMDSIFTQRILYKIIDLESGINVRANLSRVSWMMGMDHPIIGVGRGNFVLNSSKYFEQLGVDFIEQIPHNTYFGLLAEAGVIGLIMFFMPFLLIIFTLLKRYRNRQQLLKDESTLLMWIGAAMLGLGIQAFVLNVENRRFLWYLGGILIYIFENDSLFNIDQMKYKQNKLSNSGLLALALVVLMVSMFTMSRVSVKNYTHSILNNYSYEIPLENFKKGKTYEFGVGLSISVNENLTERVSVKALEIGNNGTKRILNSFDYYGASGVAIMTIVPTMSNSKIIIKATKLDYSLKEYGIQPLYLREDNQIYDLTKWYFMQPPKIQYQSIQKNKLVYDDWVSKSDLSLGIDSTFDQKLKLDSVSVNQVNDFSTIVTVILYANKNITENLIPYIYGYPNDLHVLLESQIPIGAESYGLTEPIIESSWKMGETRKFSFIIPRQFGIYDLKLGVYKIINNQTVHLYPDEAPESFFLDLGLLNLDLFKQEIIYE